MKCYITFGQIHAHKINGKTLDCNCVAEIEADSIQAAHEGAMELFDAKFHQCTKEVPDMSYFPRGIINIGSM